MYLRLYTVTSKYNPQNHMYILAANTKIHTFKLFILKAQLNLCLHVLNPNQKFTEMSKTRFYQHIQCKLGQEKLVTQSAPHRGRRPFIPGPE